MLLGNVYTNLVGVNIVIISRVLPRQITSGDLCKQLYYPIW